MSLFKDLEFARYGVLCRKCIITAYSRCSKRLSKLKEVMLREGQKKLGLTITFGKFFSNASDVIFDFF